MISVTSTRGALAPGGANGDRGGRLSPTPPMAALSPPAVAPRLGGFFIVGQKLAAAAPLLVGQKFLLLRVTDDARRSSRTRAAVAAWFLRRSPHYPASRTARRSQFPAKDGGTDGKERNHIGMEKRHKARGGRRVVFAAVAL